MVNADTLYDHRTSKDIRKQSYNFAHNQVGNQDVFVGFDVSSVFICSQSIQYSSKVSIISSYKIFSSRLFSNVDISVLLHSDCEMKSKTKHLTYQPCLQEITVIYSFATAGYKGTTILPRHFQSECLFGWNKQLCISSEMCRGPIY